MELDHIDVGILSWLQRDARTPFTKIAEDLGISDATVHLRVRKLEDRNLIEKYTIIINDDALQPITTYVLIRVTPGSVEAVCQELSQIDEIYEVSEIHDTEQPLEVKFQLTKDDYLSWFDEEQALKAGCTDFVTKPFRIGDLRNRISRYLDSL